MPNRSYWQEKLLAYSDDELFKIVSEADKNDYILTTYTITDCKHNLVGMHAYTLYSTVDLQKDGKSFQKLFKVRNPWGSEMYTGPWSDSDSKWTEDFKK